MVMVAAIGLPLIGRSDGITVAAIGAIGSVAGAAVFIGRSTPP
jgi:hypothetical protein